MDSSDQTLIRQCRAELPNAARRLDYRNFNNTTVLPHLGPLRELRQRQLRDLPLQHPIILVLMPVPKIWRETVLPNGIEPWVASVLEPLQQEGIIEIHDYTRLLDGENGIDCRAFHDLYHMNSVGQRQLTDLVLPIIEDRFYARAAKAGRP